MNNDPLECCGECRNWTPDKPEAMYPYGKCFRGDEVVERESNEYCKHFEPILKGFEE